jgi:hypothetical protein
MLPYAETEIEKILEREGRLKGDLGFRDYEFFDPALDRYYAELTRCFAKWIGEHDGLLNMARWARYYASVYKKYYPETSIFREVERAITETIADSNLFFVDTARELAQQSESEKFFDRNLSQPFAVWDAVDQSHQRYVNELNASIMEIKELSAMSEPVY